MCTNLAISQCTVLAPGQHTLVSTSSIISCSSPKGIRVGRSETLKIRGKIPNPPPPPFSSALPASLETLPSRGCSCGTAWLPFLAGHWGVFPQLSPKV